MNPHVNLYTHFNGQQPTIVNPWLNRPPMANIPNAIVNNNNFGILGIPAPHLSMMNNVRPSLTTCEPTNSRFQHQGYFPEMSHFDSNPQLEFHSLHNDDQMHDFSNQHHREQNIRPQRSHFKPHRFNSRGRFDWQDAGRKKWKQNLKRMKKFEKVESRIKNENVNDIMDETVYSTSAEALNEAFDNINSGVLNRTNSQMYNATVFNNEMDREGLNRTPDKNNRGWNSEMENINKAWNTNKDDVHTGISSRGSDSNSRDTNIQMDYVNKGIGFRDVNNENFGINKQEMEFNENLSVAKEVEVLNEIEDDDNLQIIGNEVDSKNQEVIVEEMNGEISRESFVDVQTEVDGVDDNDIIGADLEETSRYNYAKIGVKKKCFFTNNIQITFSQDGDRVAKTVFPPKDEKNFFCDVCNICCTSKEDLELHKESEVHFSKLEVVEAAKEEKTDKLVSRLGNDDEEDIDPTDSNENAETTSGKLLKFCKTCNKRISGSFMDHRKTLEHKKQKIGSKPFCQACCQILRSPKRFVEHCATKKHKENRLKMLFQANLDTKLLPGPEPISSTSQVCSETVMSSDTKLPDDKPADTQSKDIVDAAIAKESDMFNSSHSKLEYNSEVEVGSWLLVTLPGLYCKVCKKYYEDENRAKKHCRSLSHFENYKKLVDSIKREQLG